MSQITDFLPQYRELNTLFTNIVDSGAVSYAQQQIITEFYRQFADVKVFEKIFRAKMFDKLLLLERKLIDSQYLSAELHWISTHENGKADIKRLIIFLTGLAENNYFLPNRDPKIKAFFENCYHISIGQNFERSRRKQYIGEQYCPK